MVMFASPFTSTAASPEQSSPMIAGGKGGYTGTFQTNPPGGGVDGTPLGTLLQQLMGGSGQAPVHSGPVPLDVKGGWGTRTNGFGAPNGNMTGSPGPGGVGVPIGQIADGQTMQTPVMGNGTPAQPITGEKAPTPGALLPDGPSSSANPTINPGALATSQSGNGGSGGNNKSPFCSCK